MVLEKGCNGQDAHDGEVDYTEVHQGIFVKWLQNAASNRRQVFNKPETYSIEKSHPLKPVRLKRARLS